MPEGALTAFTACGAYRYTLRVRRMDVSPRQKAYQRFLVNKSCVKSRSLTECLIPTDNITVLD